MARMYVSLVLTIILASLLLGWGIDEWVAQNQESSVHQDYPNLTKLLDGLRHRLNETGENIEGKVEVLNELLPLSVQLESSQDMALPPHLHSALSQPGGLLLESSQGPYLLVDLPAYPQYLLRLGLPPQKTQDNADLYLTLALNLGLAMMIALWLFPLTKRLSLLTSASARFGQGELNARVKRNQFSYIGDLEDSFNKMADQIGQLIAENRLLASSLSHDLRTPLACFRFGLDAAIDAENKQESEYYLSRLDADLTRMESMLNAFLDYASMERQASRAKLVALDLKQLLSTIVQDNLPLFENKQLEVSTKLDIESCQVMADKVWIARAVTNILSNATKFAKQEVVVTLSVAKNTASIWIDDDGPGIAEESLQEVFKPFVSLDKSRQSGAYGLGLAIVERVVTWHNGQVSVENNANGGARFVIDLPIKNTLG